MTLGLAFGFFSANLHHPHKVPQMGRLVASGIVLSEASGDADAGAANLQVASQHLGSLVWDCGAGVLF